MLVNFIKNLFEFYVKEHGLKFNQNFKTTFLGMWSIPMVYGAKESRDSSSKKKKLISIYKDLACSTL